MSEPLKPTDRLAQVVWEPFVCLCLRRAACCIHFCILHIWHGAWHIECILWLLRSWRNKWRNIREDGGWKVWQIMKSGLNGTHQWACTWSPSPAPCLCPWLLSGWSHWPGWVIDTLGRTVTGRWNLIWCALLGSVAMTQFKGKWASSSCCHHTNQVHAGSAWTHASEWNPLDNRQGLTLCQGDLFNCFWPEFTCLTHAL